MVHRAFSIPLVIAALFIGCGRIDVPIDVKEKIDRSVASAVGATPADKPLADLSVDVAESIYRLSDNALRIQCFETWSKRLLSCNTDGMTYRQLAEYMNRAYIIFSTSIAFGLEHVHAKPEVLLDARLTFIDRVSHVLTRIRPGRNRSVSAIDLSDADRKRYEDWRNCYLTLYRMHRLLLDRLEEYDFHNAVRELPQDQREAVRRFVEDRLGRAIRPKHAIDTKRHVETEEFMSVVSRRAAPEKDR